MPAAGAGYGGRETSGNALVPAATHAEPANATEPIVEGDADDLSRYHKLVADGIMTPEEIGRIFPLSPEETDALSKPFSKPRRQSIAEELAAIHKRMREDRRGYDKDIKMQARYRELLELIGPEPPVDVESIGEGVADVDAEDTDESEVVTSPSRAAIEQELAAIQKRHARQIGRPTSRTRRNRRVTSS